MSLVVLITVDEEASVSGRRGSGSIGAPYSPVVPMEMLVTLCG